DTPVGLGPLTSDLSSWSEDSQAAASQRLAQLGRDLAPDLAEVVTHPEPTARELGIMLLARAVPDAAGPALARALRDDDPRVLRAALDSIDARHAGEEALLGRVMELAETHSDWSTRLRAVQSLGRLGESAGVATLGTILQGDRYAFVREGAATALQAIGGPEANRLLDQAAEDPEPRVRAAAARDR
ncbi:MAG: HEAT repeat domain-containing protein, partial [Myxococcota bacterium]